MLSPKDIAAVICTNSERTGVWVWEGLIYRHIIASHPVIGNMGPWSHCPSWSLHILSQLFSQMLVWVLLGRDVAHVIEASNQFILSQSKGKFVRWVGLDPIPAFNSGWKRESIPTLARTALLAPVPQLSQLSALQTLVWAWWLQTTLRNKNGDTNTSR